MQTNLHSFFKIVTHHNETNKKCFIYDPANYKAFFTEKPDDNRDTFVSIKTGVKLYYRRNEKKEETIVFPIIQTTADIPLLKSNLQKAVRRGNSSAAITTALAMLQKEPIQLLRRLPIIYIEDVCLIDSFSIIMWLLMADTLYIMKPKDTDIILQIVHSLTICSKYFDNREGTNATEYCHEYLQHSDQLLALYYRTMYGGLKGDMQMLKNAIEFYNNAPHNIVKCEFAESYLSLFDIEETVEIIVEAIDFHPFPHFLHEICRDTYIKKQIIKDIIWYAESAYNIRKQYTLQASLEYKERKEYPIIAKYLNLLRQPYTN